MSPATIQRVQTAATAIFGLLIVLVLGSQMLSLFTFPQPDGARWWGDETGQMQELRAEIESGVARMPTALGSSLYTTNGLVRGNSWFAALIYGVPAAALRGHANLVELGRVITFLLSFVLCYLMAKLLQRAGCEPIWISFAILVLVSTRSFFFASHAARLDIAAGAAVVLFILYLSGRFASLRRGEWSSDLGWWFGYGLTALFFATLSIHLLTLLGLLSIFVLWRFGAHTHPPHLLAALGGVTVMAGLLLTVYLPTGAPFTLFSQSAGGNQFHSVVEMLPILRPFSRSVQIANLLERAQGLWNEALPAMLLLGAAIVTWVLSGFTRGASTPTRSFIYAASLVILIAWLLFQSPALYYYLHVLPVFIVALVVFISKRWKESIVGVAALLLAGLGIAGFAVADGFTARRTSSELVQSNRVAIAEALRSIPGSPGSPILLAQNPAIAQLIDDPRVRLMTAHLVTFPASRVPLDDALRSLGTRYILVYRSPILTHYSDDEQALSEVVARSGSAVFTGRGQLFDVGREYFTPLSPLEDTLILYRLHD